MVCVRFQEAHRLAREWKPKKYLRRNYTAYRGQHCAGLFSCWLAKNGLKTEKCDVRHFGSDKSMSIFRLTRQENREQP